MDTASSIVIKSHFKKIRPLFQTELARLGYFGRFTVQVGFKEPNTQVLLVGSEEQIFVTLDSSLWGLSQRVVSARFSPIFEPFFATIQTPGKVLCALRG